MRKRIAASLGALALAIPLGFAAAQPADALLSYNRCSSFFVDRPIPHTNTNVTLCWQYTYQAQADGTGIKATSLFIDCIHNCGDVDYITHMTLKAVNPKTGAINDSASLAEARPDSMPVTRTFNLVGRDVGNETLRWDFDWESSDTYENHEQINDCLSLADPYFGPCDPV